MDPPPPPPFAKATLSKEFPCESSPHKATKESPGKGASHKASPDKAYPTRSKSTSPIRLEKSDEFTTPRRKKTLGTIPNLPPPSPYSINAAAFSSNEQTPRPRRGSRDRSPKKVWEQSPTRRGRSFGKQTGESESLVRPSTASASEDPSRETSPSKKVTRMTLLTIVPPVIFKTHLDGSFSFVIPLTGTHFNECINTSLGESRIVPVSLKVNLRHHFKRNFVLITK